MLRFDTAIGTCGISWNASAVTGVSILGGVDRGVEPPAFVRAAVEGIVALFEGVPRDLREVPLDLTGVDEFAAAVYAATRAVGPGEACTYGELARAVGSPGGAQAVGRALGSNPYPIVVPCHRVLSSTGALHGFSAPGGIATKRRMLEIERAPGFTQQSLFA